MGESIANGELMVEDRKEKLDGELRASLNGMSDAELMAKVSEVALYRQLREQAMASDPDVQERKRLLSEATADYRDEIKGAKAQIKCITELLEARGKV
jgi:hypothetical protein